mgnify:CR=1 FL=1
MTFTLYGEVPSKKNSRVNIRNGRSFPNKRYQAWHRKSLFELKSITENFAEPVYIKLHFYHQDNRRRDSDNGVSSVFDTLVDARIIQDDRWQIILGYEVKNDLDKKNPRVTITITTYADYLEKY